MPKVVSDVLVGSTRGTFLFIFKLLGSMEPTNTTPTEIRCDLLRVVGLALLLNAALRTDGPLTPDLHHALVQQTERLFDEIGALADRVDELDRQTKNTPQA